MKHCFTLDGIKPLSVNSTYTNVGRGRAKTQAARDWTSEFFYQLGTQENLKKLAELRETFDPAQHFYAVQLDMYYPDSLLFRKGGGISAKTVDLSNFEKSIIDCLFLPKFNNTPFPYGCENLNIDDKFVAELVSRKKAAQAHQLSIAIEIRPLSILQD